MVVLITGEKQVEEEASQVDSVVRNELLKFLLLDTATWVLSSQGMQDHFGAKFANWLPGWLAIGIINLVSNFIRPSRVAPWNEVETFCHEWSDAHKGKTVCMSNRSTSMSVSEGPQSFGAKELTY